MATENDTRSTEETTQPAPDRAADLNRLADILRAASDRLADELRAFYDGEPFAHADKLVGCAIDDAWSGPVKLDNLAKRIRAAATKPMFTRWHREIDGPRLVLVVESEDGRRIREWLELDVRELPERQDLLGRLGERARNRLLQDAERLSEAMAEEREVVAGGDA